jgi:hypothetical protein
MFSCLNFFYASAIKALQSKESWNCYHPDDFSNAMCQHSHGINGDFAGNYHLMDEESTRGMVIPPGITSSWTKNLYLKNVFFRRGSYQLRDKESTEEWDNAGKYQLIDEQSARRRGFRQELTSYGRTVLCTY